MKRWGISAETCKLCEIKKILELNMIGLHIEEMIDLEDRTIESKKQKRKRE